jgi:ribosome-binding ATPase YchF (GTP1/OBG family)
LEKIAPALREGKPIRDIELADDEQKRIRGFRFLTEKPVLVLLNIGEPDIAVSAQIVADFAARYSHRQSGVEALSARIEMEIGQLDEEEGAVFRTDLGLTESSLKRVIRDSYRLLGLISFFTAGPDETRAWTIPSGSSAVDAAGAIHSDLARGFIRAEVVAYEDLIELGSMAEARKRGRLRSEGKTYQVKDGDTLEVLFNV